MYIALWETSIDPPGGLKDQLPVVSEDASVGYIA